MFPGFPYLTSSTNGFCDNVWTTCQGAELTSVHAPVLLSRYRMSNEWNHPAVYQIFDSRPIVSVSSNDVLEHAGFERDLKLDL